MRRLLGVLCALLLLPTLASAQISPTFTFVAGTVASPDEVNANFALLNNALNRTGGTMTGTLTSRAIVPSATNTYDLATTATRFKDGWFAGNLTVTGTITGGTVTPTTLTCTGCVGATQIAATAVTLGSYGSSTAIPTYTVDADGRLTAAANVTPQLTLTSTYFSSLSGANLTGVPISTGVSGLGSNVATFLATPSSANLAAALTNETGSGAAVFATSPTLVTPVLGAASADTLSLSGGVYLSPSGTSGIVCDGATVNHDISSNSGGTFWGVLRLTSGGSGICHLGGLTSDGVDGRTLLIVNNTSQILVFDNEDTGSSVAYRFATPLFQCRAGQVVLALYNQSLGRWQLLGV